jgi:hypothetical protein
MEGQDLHDYCKEAIMDGWGNELVTEDSGCPKCGERRMDWLEWDAAVEIVTCATCGARYDPMEA